MNFVRIIFQPAHPLAVKNLTKKNFPYQIGWICIFIWLYSYFLPMGGFRFESSLYNQNVGSSVIYFYIWFLTSCIIPILFDGKKFVSKTIYSIAAALACFILIGFTGISLLSQGLMLIASACIGHIFASFLYSFFMILNNSEKFYSMIFAVFLPKLLMYVKPMIHQDGLGLYLPYIIIAIVMIILGVCTCFIKRNKEEIPGILEIKAPPKAYALMPLVFVVFAINDVIAPASLKQITDLPRNQIEGYYFLGIIVGIAVVLLWQRRFQINICNMLNISFAFLAIGFVLDITRLQNSTVGFAEAICFGASYAIGFINIYYFLGFMIKKFQSISYYRISVALSTLYYGLAFILIEEIKGHEIISPAFMAVTSICIVILFFILTPFFMKMLYSGDWIEDTYRLDVTRCSRLEGRLKDYKLTPAETEVCRLLLEGYTLRQISSMQSKAYATINTYCTSIYRKLNINSRTELLLLLQNYIEK